MYIHIRALSQHDQHVRVETKEDDTVFVCVLSVFYLDAGSSFDWDCEGVVRGL